MQSGSLTACAVRVGLSRRLSLLLATALTALASQVTAQGAFVAGPAVPASAATNKTCAPAQGAFVTGPTPSASAANKAAPAERSISEWLLRMHEASRNRSYLGTFVVSSAAGGMSSARIWHACDGDRQLERVESLTGTPRSTFRRNDEVVTFLPESRVVLKEKREFMSLFPNVLTALVTTMSMALVAVLALLAKDARRRLRAEHDLADALAFRKAMEDSLVTGLRARDLKGRITYVNPAFCDMVGFSLQELQGQTIAAPYWPPELTDEYQKRQAVRLSGQHVPPREGFESVFMRKDGSRFPVLIIEAPLINAQGLQTGWMSAFVDISEQRRVQELQRASQERLQATARLATGLDASQVRLLLQRLVTDGHARIEGQKRATRYHPR